MIQFRTLVVNRAKGLSATGNFFAQVDELMGNVRRRTARDTFNGMAGFVAGRMPAKLSLIDAIERDRFMR